MSIEGRAEAARIIYQDQLKRAKMLDTEDYYKDCSIKQNLDFVMSNSEIVPKSKFIKPQEFDYNFRSGAPVLRSNSTYEGLPVQRTVSIIKVKK